MSYFLTATQGSSLPAWKRVLDLSLILMSSPVLLLLSVCVAILIKCGSRGPIIFRQRRIGYKGREFICYKFRTMKVNVETKIHQDHFHKLVNAEIPMTKPEVYHNSYFIPFGSILRNTGLDELPQLINILRGEMSIVGPRPCIPYEYEHYKLWQRRRFDAIPGLTGLWQINGKNQTTFNQMIQLDVKYLEQISLRLDLIIILKTVPILMNQCIAMFVDKLK